MGRLATRESEKTPRVRKCTTYMYKSNKLTFKKEKSFTILLGLNFVT